VKARLNPTAILTAAKKGQEFFNQLASNCALEAFAMSLITCCSAIDESAPFNVVTIKGSDFSYESAQNVCSLIRFSLLTT